MCIDTCVLRVLCRLAYALRLLRLLRLLRVLRVLASAAGPACAAWGDATKALFNFLHLCCNH